MNMFLQFAILFLNIKNILLCDEIDIYGSVVVPYIRLDLNLCNRKDVLCGNRPHDHIMCNRLKTHLENCTDFKLIKMTNELKVKIVLGHNSFRNAEAQRAYYEIPNMNQLYWDTNLGEMAYQYVLRCNILGPSDDCHYIGNKNHTIGQNRYYVEFYPVGEPWLDAALHSWYNYTMFLYNPPQFNSSLGYSELTQILWPTTKYVGCAAARIKKGILFVCYYGPMGNHGRLTDTFKIGEICSNCPTRSSCSNVFPALCDYLRSRGFIGIQPNTYWMVLVAWFIGVIFNT